ncbi:hypothetical protein CPB86DRAFT_875930 [Serendipita vermifera]|nr:hypothetical protein CPB86DRAFT_875930 [Serendipita vermifera]
MDTPNIRQPAIHKVPVEILQDIFVLHWVSNKGSRLALLLVCRRWTNIGLTTKGLWSKIHFGRDLERPLDSPYTTCLTTGTLSRVLQRLRDGNFDLTVSLVENRPPKLTASDVVTLSGCRRLKMVNGNSDAFLQLLSDLRSLEELEIFCTNGVHFQRLFELLNTQNTRLTRLSLEGHLDRQWCRYSNMLGRIRMLDLHYYGTASPEDMVEFFGYLTSLEQLTLSGTSLVHRTYSIHSKGLHTMTIKYPLFFLFTPQTYRNVVQLSITHDPNAGSESQSLDVHNTSIMMPSLERLTIAGPWDPLLSIDAPRLHTLSLKKGRDEGRRVRALLGMRVVPEVLTIEDLPQLSSFKPLLDVLMPYRMVLNLSHKGDDSIGSLSDVIVRLQKKGNTVRWNGSAVPRLDEDHPDS